MHYQTIKVVRVDPLSITSEHAIAPLEQLGEVSVEEVAFEQITVKPLREPKPQKPSIASMRSVAWKEACVRLIEKLQPCTTRQVWDELYKEEHNIRLVTVQLYLKELAKDKKLEIIQRRKWIKGRRCYVNYYHIQGINKGADGVTLNK